MVPLLTCSRDKSMIHRPQLHLIELHLRRDDFWSSDRSYRIKFCDNALEKRLEVTPEQEAENQLR